MDLFNSEIFIEQAEYLSRDSFNEWSTSIHNESIIVKKLSSSGAKLISGPRGSGKTTLLLKVFNKLISPTSKILPIYVNFKSSLKLEPLYRINTNAAYWFNQWVIYKVLQGLKSSVENLNQSSNHPIDIEDVDEIISTLELGEISRLSNLKTDIRKLENEISKTLITFKKTRCILLLDDAGHAFSTEQQQDFFEFFREVKSKTISPKAAVYPGVTSYSNSFHIGHDAEEIDVWVKPNTEGYLDFMNSILKTRLGQQHFDRLNSEPDYLKVLCFSAYGIPRALLNMVSDLQEVNNNETRFKMNAKSILSVIKANFDLTYQIYDSLRIKLPMYSNFIEKGSEIFDRCLTINKNFNRGQSVRKQSSIIAIKRPLSTELSKVLGFFQYAGLISDSGISNRGGKGVYELFELHYGAIIDRNVFFSSRGINYKNYSLAFSNRPNHLYPRYQESGIVIKTEGEEYFQLALPPCPNCNTPRISEESKFCSNCGVKLKDASIFESIVSQDIDNLPITSGRASSIKDGSKIKTIKDILLDSDNKQLRQVNMIGPVWAKRIKSYAEEYIA